MYRSHQFIGELLGTFLLVLFGCGAVAVSVLFGAHSGLFSWLAGWGVAAFPDDRGGFFWVYVVGPICGGAMAALLFVRVIEPAMGPEPGAACGAGDTGSACGAREDARGDGNAR